MPSCCVSSEVVLTTDYTDENPDLYLCNLCSICQTHQDLVGCHRQLAHAHAARIEHRIHDRAERGTDAAFPNPDHRLAFVFIIDERHHLGHLQTSRQLVIAQARIEHHAEMRIHHAPFPQRHPERLNHAAIDLALHRQTIQRQAAVLDMDHLDRLDVSGLDVDFN